MDIINIISADQIDIISKLFLALLLGMSLGIERAIAGKTAGMRTYGLVTMGSALLAMTGVYIGGGFESSTAFVDSLRFSAQIIVGIGFIGAGLIFIKGVDVSGVTTAAGIWVAAGVGIATGYGFYTLALATTVLGILTFTFFWYVEDRLKAIVRHELE